MCDLERFVEALADSLREVLSICGKVLGAMEAVRAAAVVSNSFGCVQNSAEGCGFRSGREGGEVKRVAVRGSGFVDRSHEAFYSLRVRCGKKEKAGKVAKVREMVKSVRRDLWPLQSASVQQAAVELEWESPSQFIVCNPVSFRGFLASHWTWLTWIRVVDGPIDESKLRKVLFPVLSLLVWTSVQGCGCVYFTACLRRKGIAKSVEFSPLFVILVIIPGIE